ncbi:unnamed protein product [Chilo suppressalis]|uniref:Integrin beta epidermal growth factor-like domain-containing protein n=1 Tax=Chilo suppressalis TaxID=168631 RepID=A0ABN8L6A2_CHISP|nr:unnamed protein product [Chilo suppressalis]
MRTMAGFVFFSVVMVASLLPQVFAINCLNVSLENIMNCNDCIRCGGYWCNKPREKNSEHCSAHVNDNWCPGVEEVPAVAQESVPSTLTSLGRYPVTAKVDKSSPRISYNYEWTVATKPNVHITVLNTTQTDNVQIFEKTDCSNGKCITHLSVQPETNFCLPDSGKFEFVNMKIRVDNVTEDATVKYHVPCACACSDKVERNSPTCNKNGDFSCGVCSCKRGWSGKFCDIKEQPKCDDRRGDLQCTNPYKDYVECSGNGYCGPCDSCICYDDREGSQYFQTDNFCADLCMTIASMCEPCLRDKPLGKCADCSYLTIQAYNRSLLEQRDDYNRKVWVKCTEKIDECNYNYAAMRDANDDIYVMKISNCNAISEAVAGGGVNPTLPIVLGVIALVAAATAVAGYMFWKARNAPLPLAASQYQELDGPEGSTGINPLYKSPTSSYNNPMWKGAKV